MRSALLACLLFALAAMARGDVVHLKDGRVLDNCTAACVGGMLHVTREGALTRIPLDRVKSIERSRRVDEQFKDGAIEAAPRDWAPAFNSIGELYRVPLPESGRVQAVRHEVGDFLIYVPRLLRRPVKLVMLFHGTPDPGDSAFDVAAGIIRRPQWAALAEEQGAIVISVAFDDERYFGSRYLEGDPLPADRFVLGIAELMRLRYQDVDPRLYLYGHSAGAQFVVRFAQVHPERVASVVASAPGSYAFPDETLDWPYGMHDAPNPAGFIAAAAKPITVIVGKNDNEMLPLDSQQRGSTRILRGENWVAGMTRLAREHNLTPRAKFVLVEGLDHTSFFLGAEALQYLFQ